MRLRILSLAVLCCLAAIAVPSAASAKVKVGISENSPAVFADPLFTGLGVKQVRLVVSWNAVAASAKGDDEFTNKIVGYVAAAQRAGIDVLLAPEHARGDTHSCTKRSKKLQCQLPSVAAYKAQIKLLLTALPTIKSITAWNESNAGTQPTASNPKRAGQYAKAVDQVCKSLKRACNNVVMDVLDTADNTHAKHLKYTRTGRFIKTLRKAYGKKPSICGIHNYADVNRFRTNGTKQLTKAMKCSHYWLTETGGIFKFGGFWKKPARKAGHCASANACQKKAMTYLFKKTIKAAKHIDRAYIFNFYRGTDGIHDYGVTTGTGTLGASDVYGSPRPAYSVLKSHI